MSSEQNKQITMQEALKRQDTIQIILRDRSAPNVIKELIQRGYGIQQEIEGEEKKLSAADRSQI